MDKNIIRKQKLYERKSLSYEAVINKSKVITDKLKNDDLFINCSTILLYSDYNNEVVTRDIFSIAKNMGKMIAYPKSYIMGDTPCMDFYIVDSLDELISGYKGIMEPADNLTKLDVDKLENVVCIVPGVAFDKQHMRIGYGKGFYDRFLSAHHNIKTIAPAYDFQIVDFIDSDANDIPIDLIITENSIF